MLGVLSYGMPSSVLRPGLGMQKVARVLLIADAPASTACPPDLPETPSHAKTKRQRVGWHTPWLPARVSLHYTVGLRFQNEDVQPRNIGSVCRISSVSSGLALPSFLPEVSNYITTSKPGNRTLAQPTGGIQLLSPFFIDLKGLLRIILKAIAF